jgi:hypothetical protein
MLILIGMMPSKRKIQNQGDETKQNRTAHEICTYSFVVYVLSYL